MLSNIVFILVGSEFSFGAHANGEYHKDTADYTFDEANSSMTLKGTQVIGYSCTLVPKYPTS